MGPTSELGPVDPQIVLEEDGKHKWFSAHSLVGGYKDLFDRAVKTKGNVEPFLQQLGRYDDRLVRQFQRAIQLSEDIAIKALASGMMKSKTKKEIPGRD